MACSSDENSKKETESPEKKIKTLEYTIYDNIFSKKAPNEFITFRGEFMYENNRPVKLIATAINLKNEAFFEYQGDQMKRIKVYDGQVMDHEIDYFYKNNLLDYSRLVDNYGDVERRVYLFNNQQLVQETVCDMEEEECVTEDLILYTYAGNNITETTEQFDSGIETKISYTFDRSMNPFTHMPLAIRILYQEDLASLNTNNVIQQTLHGRSGTNDLPIVIHYTYVLDSDNYPLTVIGKDRSGKEYVRIAYTYL